MRPLPHLKNPYYKNVKSTQKSVNLSPSNGELVSAPHLHLTWGVWGAFYKTPHFWGVGKVTHYCGDCGKVTHYCGDRVEAGSTRNDFTTLTVKIDTKI